MSLFGQSVILLFLSCLIRLNKKGWIGIVLIPDKIALNSRKMCTFTPEYAPTWGFE